MKNNKKKQKIMNEFADALLQYSYRPAINVYIVWIFGAYTVYKYSIFAKTLDDLSDLEKKKYKGIMKNGKLNKFKYGLLQFIIIPALATMNDVIFLWIGGPAIVVYNKLWWGQFFSFDTILSFVNS